MSGAQPALVLVPGLGSDGWIWAQQAEALADVAAVSIGDTLHDDSIAGMAARILSQAPARFALGGISMGGYVAFEIVRQAPDRVTRIAFLDTSARPDTPEQTQARRAGNARIAAGEDYEAMTRAGREWLIHPDAPDAVAEGLVAMALRVGPEMYMRQQEAIIARPDSRPLLPTIAVPALVVAGAEDRMIPPAMVEEIAAGIPGARMAHVARCGHLPPVERPAETTALLRAWLAG